jgi:arabinofuranosyltransferase
MTLRYLRERRYLGFVVLSFLVAALMFQNFVVDDAYISFVYSRNLIAGNGLTYNGMLVEGFSNPLWTVLIAPFLCLGIDALVAARALSILSGILILLVLDSLIRITLCGISNGRVALALTTVTLCSSFVAWTVGGLETIFFAFLIMLFVYLEIGQPRRAVYLSPLIVLMISLTRPEGAMFFPILVAYRLYCRRKVGRDLIFSVLLFALPFGLFLLWRYHTYGYPLPNTAYVKMRPSLWTVSLALEWLISFVVLRPIYALVLLVSAVILLVEEKLLDHQWILVFMIIGAFIAFVLYAGRDWMPFHRFLAPLVPIFALMMAKAIHRFRSGIAGIVIIGLIVGSGLFELFMSATVYQGQITDFGRYTDGLLEAGRMIRQETQQGSMIAVEDAGALAYSSERTAVDILGLNNEYIAHHPGLDVAEYVLSLNPEIVQLHLNRLPSGELVGSRDSRVSGAILNDPAFSSCYRLLTDPLDHPYMPYLFYRECH